MITNFEEYTGELSVKERKMMKMIIPVLQEAIGKNRAITNNEMIEILRSYGQLITAPRIRAIIHEIRVKRLVLNLIATTKGYYVATTYKEITEYIKSLKERESSLRSIRETFENPVLFI